MLRHLLILVAELMLFAIFGSSQLACHSESVTRSSASVRKLQSDLLAVNVAEGGMEPAVPAEAQRLIRTLKDEFTSLTDASLECLPVSFEAKQLEHELAVIAGANKPDTRGQPEPADPHATIDNIYGRDLRVVVKHPSNKPDLVTVELSFSIDCGNDSMLLVYENQNSHWHRVLRWQRENVQSISDGLGDLFQYALIPLGSTRKWGVAVVHGSPWCTSRWSGFELDVLSPADEKSPQRTVFHRKHGYVRFEDVEPTLKTRPDGFDLRLTVGTIESERMTRGGVYRYRTTGEQIERIQPVAMNGRDFVDEWIQVKWPEAEPWSLREHIADLKTIHDLIEKRMQSDSKDYPRFSYGPVRACADDHHHFQVTIYEGARNGLYFQISQGANSFSMLSASANPNAACTGADLMESH